MKILPSFFVGLWRFLLFALLECFCILTLYNKSIAQHYRLESLVTSVQSFFWEKLTALNNYSNLRNINEQLSLDNIKLLNKIDKLKTISIDSTNKDTTLLFNYIGAKVIKNTINTTHNYLIINKGRKDGVEKDMGLISSNGVIGIISAVSDNCAYVLSFLNTDIKISAKVGKENTFGSLSWDTHSSNGAILRDIPQHIGITTEDTIYTSGYSTIFPPDIPIGIATESKIVEGTHKEINVKLFQDFSQLNYVMVVDNKLGFQIDSLINSTKNE